MSSTFSVHIGPYAGWLVSGSLTVTWEDGSGEEFEGKLATVWTEELDPIVERGLVTVNINGMYNPPCVVIKRREHFRVCGFPSDLANTGGLLPRRMGWDEDDREFNVVELTAIDREAEMEWFARTFAAGLAALSDYFQTPAHAIRWGFVGIHT
jgi:hypothetical protein